MHELVLSPTFQGVVTSDALTPPKEYIASLDSEQSRRVMASALGTIAKHVEPGASWDTFPWHKLGWSQLLAIREWAKNTYQLATANRLLTAIRGVLRAAFNQRLLTADEYMRLRSFKAIAGQTMTRGVALTIDQVKALYRACGTGVAPAQHARDRVLLATLCPLGLRRGEVVALNVGHFSRERNLLLVRGKGNKERQVTLGAYSAAVFKEWVEEHHPSADDHAAPLLCGMTWNHTPTGQRMHTNTVSKILKRLFDDAGLRGDISSHDLRKTTGTLMLASGVDGIVVANVLGHSSVDTTRKHYDMQAEQAMRAAVSKLEESLR